MEKKDFLKALYKVHLYNEMLPYAHLTPQLIITHWGIILKSAFLYAYNFKISKMFFKS